MNQNGDPYHRHTSLVFRLITQANAPGFTDMSRGIGHKGQMARPLYCQGQGTLVFSASARFTAGQNLTPV